MKDLPKKFPYEPLKEFPEELFKKKNPAETSKEIHYKASLETRGGIPKKKLLEEL